MKDYRADLGRIFMSAVEYADPEYMVRSRVLNDDGCILIDSEYVCDPKKIYLFAFGKAAVGMAKGFMSVCDVDRGIVVTNSVEKFPDNIKVIKAGHPLPDKGSMDGAEAMLDLARMADNSTLCVFLVSGGGSALLCAPAFGITLEEKVRTFDLLIRSGADIEDINIVRRHISYVKGGRLAEAAAPAVCVTLAVSDVLSGSPEAIASGPTYSDHTTWADAAEVIERYRLFDKLPVRVAEVIRRGELGEMPETVKENINQYRYHTLASNIGALKVAGDQAHMLGYKVRMYGQLDCCAREAAEIMAARVNENLINASDTPVCMIFGGEVTVSVQGSGKGGRCQQLALEYHLQDKPADTFVLCASTDGMDGNTDAAGAFADGSISRDGAEEAAFNNNAYNFFSNNRSLLKTGLTGTNVNDLYMIIIPQFEMEGSLQAFAEAKSCY
ncbi:Glycerate kinase [Denitrovibrio acetiphilus DSM 12809]|uniref:Glycerate kinase n=1 Tax=Denitrovibrio acetiphilus (strain DSM 12809 / NBRC 114555 / N2460) TaxID=522772 RepID=D4H6K3_DENA2|nr:DUF4147 domain-containing protein [Denitrovibrio acetiphilus]ADD69677.1 Glycerate kinase [Denitrovibrio acetiphilus DSM 12809]